MAGESAGERGILSIATQQELQTGASSLGTSEGTKGQLTSPRFYNAGPTLPYKDTHFIGREAVVQKIVQSLTQDPNPSRVIIIVGIPGMGKTEVAIHVGHLLQEEHNKPVIFIQEQRNFSDVCSEIIRQINPLAPKISDSHDMVSIAKRRLLEVTESKVIVLDATEGIQQQGNQFDDFLRYVEVYTPEVQLIITTREDVGHRSLDTLKVRLDRLDSESSAKLLQNLVPNCEEQYIKELGNLCGGIPLVLINCARLLEDFFSPKTLVAQLKEYPVPLLNTNAEDVYNALRQFLSNMSENIKANLVRLSVFPSAFSVKDMKDLFDNVLEPVAVKNTMIRRSLLRRIDHEKLVLHRLVREFVKVERRLLNMDDVGKKAQHKFNQHYLELLETSSKQFISKRWSRNAIFIFRREKANILEMFRNVLVEGGDKKEIESCIDVANSTKVLYFLSKVLRPPSACLRLYERCCHIAEASNDTRRLADSLASRGFLGLLKKVCRGVSPDTFELFQRAYEIRKNLPKELQYCETHAHTISKLGLCYALQGEVGKGLKLIQEAIDLRKELGVRLYVAAGYCDLGNAHFVSWDREQAINIWKTETLPVYKDELGDHPWTASILRYIGISCMYLVKSESADSGIADQAEMYLREALELRIKLLGEHHCTARSHVDLSDILIVKKDFKSAMEQLEKAIEIQEKVLGEEHDTTKNTLARLRKIQSMCEGEKGRVLIQEGIELRKELEVPVIVAASNCDLRNKLKKKTIKDDEDIIKDKRNNNEDLIPAFVRARGEKALAAYHRALETGGSTYDKRVKVLLVGQDRVGKTSLGKALRGEPFDEAELSTDGVQMIPAVKNAETGAWRNPASLEHTTVFDHKVAAKTAEDLLSKRSEQPAKKQPRTVASNKTDQLLVEDENAISSKADEGKTQLPQQKEASREVKENQAQKNQIPILSKADEGKFQLRQQEEVPSEVKENQAQKSQDQDLENQAKPSGLPDEIAIIVEQHLEKNEADTHEKIWPILWDFAGQDIYRAIHPIFMSSDDIYLLAFDLTKKLSEKAECRVNIGHKELTATARDSEDTNLDHLCRWMDLIHSLKNFQRDGLSYPPVILVGTHADRVDDPRKAVESVVDKKCLKVFDEYTYLLHIADYRPIDNTKSGKSTDQEEIIELRKKILELADKMPHTKKKIPLQWHRVEKEICQPDWQQEKYLLLESFREKIVSRYCTFEDEDDFDELVYFLHGRGTIVYHEHEHDKKKGLIVLNPQWLINVLCEIVKVKPDDKELVWIRKDREKLAEEGVLRERLIDHTCSKEKVGLIKDSLISLMDKFNLICKWPEKAEETNTEESQILVPCMLNTFYKEKKELGNAAPIYLTFQTKYVPYGLFCRLVVLFVKSPQFKQMYRLCANEARIPLDNESYVLQLLCYKAVIKLQIFADHGGTPPQKLYDDVLSQLNEFLKKLRKECHWLRSMSGKLCARCTVCMGNETKPCARHNESSCRHRDCGHYIPLGGEYFCSNSGLMLEIEPLVPWIRANEHVSKKLNISSAHLKSHGESWSLQVTESLKTASNPPAVTVTLLRNENLPGISVPLDKSQLPIDILLLTVKDWEFLACMSCLNRDFCRSYCEELRQDVYLGKIGNDDMMLKIAVVKCYTGSTVPQGSWVTVTNAVKVLKPKAVIGVGCCGGLDPAKFKLGDVVVSVKLITYSSSKVTDKGITERGVRVPLRSDISKLMLTAAHGWKAPLKNPKEFEVDMHLGVFLSGPESVDSSARREELKERFSEADVIEMEGEGVYEAAQELNIPWTIIKGVSNYADGEMFEPNPWKKFASLMAASVTVHILSNPVTFKGWRHYQSTEEPPQETSTYLSRLCRLT